MLVLHTAEAASNLILLRVWSRLVLVGSEAVGTVLYCLLFFYGEARQRYYHHRRPSMRVVGFPSLCSCGHFSRDYLFSLVQHLSPLRVLPISLFSLLLGSGPFSLFAFCFLFSRCTWGKRGDDSGMDAAIAKNQPRQDQTEQNIKFEAAAAVYSTSR